MSQGKIHKN